MGLQTGLQIIGKAIANYSGDATRLAAQSGDNVAGIFCRQVKPINPESIKGLRFEPSEIGDTVCFSKQPWRKLIPNLQEKINPQNFLGGGFEANVYGIDDSYVLRMYDGATRIDSEFLPVLDIFEGRNFGQAVARTKKGVSINRRVPGVPMYKCNDSDPKIYMRNLREYANLSDDTLESFVADVAYINSKGWRIDQSNPENFLIDKATGKIGIVDLSRKGSSSLDLFEPYGHDWILAPLVNSHDVFAIYKKLSPVERKELFDLIEKLEKRILPLCEKYGIPNVKWNRDDYAFRSLINLLDFKGKINVSTTDDLWEPIIYERYPKLIKSYKIYKEKKI